MKHKMLAGVSSLLALTELGAVSHPCQAAVATLNYIVAGGGVSMSMSVYIDSSRSTWRGADYYCSGTGGALPVITHDYYEGIGFTGVGTFDDPGVASFNNLTSGNYTIYGIARGFTFSQSYPYTSSAWNASAGDKYYTIS